MFSFAVFLLVGILGQLDWYFALDWFIIGSCSCLESLGAVNPQRNGSFPCATYLSLCSNVGNKNSNILGKK